MSSRTADSPARAATVSGDTLLIDELGEISLRFEAIEAGILHLGAPDCRRAPPIGLDRHHGWFARCRGGRGGGLAKVIPVHFDDYGVFASPLSEFRNEMTRRGMADRTIEIGRGETVQM